jgi:hypothetical protein
MHTTAAGEKRKALKIKALELAREVKAAKRAAKSLPEADKRARDLQKEATRAIAEAEDLKLQARIEDIQVWTLEKTKATKKGSQKYTYWMASWREGDKVRNVHLGSSRKISRKEALLKARTLKAEALATININFLA